MTDKTSPTCGAQIDLEAEFDADPLGHVLNLAIGIIALRDFGKAKELVGMARGALILARAGQQAGDAAQFFVAADKLRIAELEELNRNLKMKAGQFADEAFKAEQRVADLRAQLASAQKDAAEGKKLAYGHREDFYLLANARRIGLMPIHEVKGMPNWVFAKNLFATGSASAYQICTDAGVDPDGYTAIRAQLTNPTGN